jgi:ABC-type nitrate/sulfonate/bicarbonate transport system permease component
MLRKWLYPTLFVLFILLVWQIVEDRLDIGRIAAGLTSYEAFVPTPIGIVNTFLKDGHIILPEISITIARAMAGFSIGVALAIFMSSLFHFFPGVRITIYPVAIGLNSFPIVGFAPAVILLFGQGTWTSIVVISVLISYFPVLITLDHSLRSTDRNLLDFMRVINASKLQVLTRVKFPLALPALFNSMKLAAPASIIGATMGEWLGSRSGIGQLITVSLYQLKPGRLYASLLAIMFCGAVLVMLISFLERILIPWYSTEHKD